MHTEFYLTYTELSQEEINQSFLHACGFDNIKAAKHLLFSKEPPFNAEWDKVKHSAFKISNLNNNEKSLYFLIMEMKIDKDYEIESFLKFRKNPYAESLFLERDMTKKDKKTTRLKI